MLDPALNFHVGRRVGISHRGEAFGESLDADGHDLAVQRHLASEVVVEERLVDARAAGDAIDTGGVEPAFREFLGGGAENRRPLCRP